MTHSTSSSPDQSIPPQVKTITGASRNDDVLDFWLRWHNHRPKDKRAKWAFVYIASDERDFIWADGLARQVKIGVSVKPWKRVREVSARSIIFSRWVYRPYILEKGLHSHFREYGQRDIRYRQEHGDAVYLRDRSSFVSDEWFVLPPEHLNDAMRIIDFWQLTSPIDDAGRPLTFKNYGEPWFGVFEYDSFRADLAYLHD